MNCTENADREALRTLSNNRVGVTKPAKPFAPLSKAEQIAKAKQEKEALRQAMIQERADKAARLAAERKAEAELKAKERQLAADAAARRLAAAKAERELRTARAKSDAQDVALMKKQKEERRRESLAFRNKEAGRIAKFVADEEQESLAQFHESVIVCGRAEFDDVSAQKKSAAARRRDSLAYRNKESARQSAALLFKEGVAKAQANAIDSRSQRDAFDDVQALKKQADQRKRESLAWRNQNASRQASIVEDEQAEAVAAAAEAAEKARQDAADVQALKKQADQRKRESLAWRNQNASRQASIVEDEQAEAVAAAAEAAEKARQDAADVQALKKQADQRKRESLAWRNLEASRVASLEDTSQAAVAAARESIVFETVAQNEEILEQKGDDSGAVADISAPTEVIPAPQPPADEAESEVSQITTKITDEQSILPGVVPDAKEVANSIDAATFSTATLSMPTESSVATEVEDQPQSDQEEVPNGEQEAICSKNAQHIKIPASQQDCENEANPVSGEAAVVTKVVESSPEVNEFAQEAAEVTARASEY